jgi:CHAD domain-containing protein
MAFQLKPKEAVGKGSKRLVRRQTDAALRALRPGGGDDEAVHEARKHFKRVRALLRLVRDELGEEVYRRENACFRDAGRPLTEVRDAKVLVEALGRLTRHFAGQVAAGAFAPVRKALQANRRAVRKRVLQEEDALGQVTEAVEGARGRLPDWTFRHRGWPALSPGLRRVYKGGYRALAAAWADPTVENLHEWRKQAKYLWHQLQVLEPVWPGVMGELGNQVHQLTRLLGDDHDLAVLRQTVTADPETFGGAGALESLLALIDRRREELVPEAFLLGRRLYRDRPRAFADRIKGYWKAWQAESAAGPLAQITLGEPPPAGNRIQLRTRSDATGEGDR